MSAPRKIWVDYERDMFSFEVDEPTSGRPTAYHHDDVVRELVEALEKCLNYIKNTESEFGIVLDSGEVARAALAKIAQEG